MGDGQGSDSVGASRIIAVYRNVLRDHPHGFLSLVKRVTSLVRRLSSKPNRLISPVYSLSFSVGFEITM